MDINVTTAIRHKSMQNIPETCIYAPLGVILQAHSESWHDGVPAMKTDVGINYYSKKCIR